MKTRRCPRCELVLRDQPLGLTPRQMEALALLAQGLSNQQIAEQMVICPKAVENIINIVYRHFGLPEGGGHARVQATRIYLGWRHSDC